MKKWVVEGWTMVAGRANDETPGPRAGCRSRRGGLTYGEIWKRSVIIIADIC